MTSARARWGLWGLLAFEAILLAFTAASGSYTYMVTAGLGVVALAYAARGHRLTGEIPRVAMALMTLSTLARAMLQSVFAGWPLGNLPSYLVPAGFLLLALPRAPTALAVALIALARSWFVLWYFLAGSPTLVVANVIGAAAAWYWWSGEALSESPSAIGDEPARQ